MMKKLKENIESQSRIAAYRAKMTPEQKKQEAKAAKQRKEKYKTSLSIDEQIDINVARRNGYRESTRHYIKTHRENCSCSMDNEEKSM